MSTEDKVADVGNRNYIDVLPTEVLCKIFDRLDFEGLKTGSLVCQRWNDIISTSGYAERFVFEIDMYFKHDSQEESMKQMLAEVRKMLGKTKRCYQQLKWISDFWIDDQEIRLVWNAIHPKITVNLHSLELYGANTAMMTVFPEIAEQLPSMVQLRSLILEFSGYNDYLQNPTILRSNSVNHLKAITNTKFRVEMPKLENFEGSLSSIYPPNENLSSLTLTDLKNLIVGNFYSDEPNEMSKSAAYSLFQLWKNIETIKWDCGIEDEIFNLLCNMCTSLRELTIRSIGTGRKNYRSMIHFDLTKLTNLTKLEMGNTYIDFVKLPKSIRKLKINLYHRQMIQTLIDSSKSLEELQVVFSTSYEVSLLETLSVLQRLEVLVLYGGHFEESSFLHMNAPLERVRQLRFVRCKLSTKSFLGIQEKFPNLKEPQFC
ncbi:uncharacterized protein LOC126575140 [Anopheles aquasalis]|uniref:uncharacterized protein LOC126575140 n=1 Tax=Anopheles aquasalis TaxID=42839 RepID=UPI00215B0149|nr:uncharacterized protein LOC126575140 [Anopheles aquasalis]